MPSTKLGPAFVAMLGIGFLCLMDGFVKYVSSNHSTVQLVFMRYAFGALVVYGIFRASGTPWPSRETLRPHAWRSVVVVITSITFFYSIATLPLAVALGLSFTSPIFIALFARLILKERPGREIFAALALGFAGVLVMLWNELARPGEATALGLIAALLSAVSYALSMVVLKTRAARDPIPTIVLLQNGLSGLLIAPVAAFNWTPPNVGEMAIFAVIGVLGACGHMCMAWAYGRADASRLGVFEYTAFVWAVAIGLIAFGEIPSVATVVGAGLIVLGATMVSRTPRAKALHEPEVEIGP